MKKHIKKLIVLAASVAVFVTLLILKENQAVCEFFATTISRAWIAFFGTIFGWLPFSAYELFLVLAILGVVAFVVFVIIFLAKRRWQRLLSLVLAVAIGVVSFLNVYTVSASFAYNRDPLPENIYKEYTSEQFTVDEARDLAEKCVEKANYCYENTKHDENGDIVYPFTFSELSTLLAEEYEKIDGDYLSSYTPRGKRIVNKWIMSQLHITGVFFAPFGEANVNGNETGMYLPSTLAHEMAHGKGVMQEYQANLVAMFVCLNSENPYIAYGSAVKAAYYAISLLSLYPNTNSEVTELYKKMNGGISVEQTNYALFYSQFTLFDDVGEFFNNLYLKLQKQKDGTGSYVKPGETVDTDEKDDDGDNIVQILSFSANQNLLIHLYKMGMVW